MAGPGRAARYLLEAAWLAAVPAAAQTAAPVGPAEQLGRVDFTVSCSPHAQASFDHALALLHHMTYPEARAGFERTVGLDSTCAMAHWGVAMTLFQPLWPTRPGPDDLRRGRAELALADSAGRPTERERRWLAAAHAFFDGDSVPYWDRIRHWQVAMEQVHAADPDDLEGSVWLALADLAVAPPGDTTHAWADRAAALLLEAGRRNPDHPGAMHYLIHANDVSGREHDSPAVVRRYDRTAPRNPHALHMPTHIYTRLGQWRLVVDGNRRAAAAALDHPVDGAGGAGLVWDEFAHAIEYLVYADLQLGADDSARATIERLRRTERLQPTFKTAFHLASTAARYTLERHAWREARALVPRDPPALDWDQFPWAEAVTWFARGLGAAHEGAVVEARSAEARLGELEAAARRSGEELFARQIGILRLGVAGWLAQAEGHRDTAVALLQRAAALEVVTPKPAVTPAPTIPAEELLGDLLLAQHRPAAALAAYRRSLARYPNRRNSLRGAERAAKVLRP